MLSGFELYRRWVPLFKSLETHPIKLIRLVLDASKYRIRCRLVQRAVHVDHSCSALPKVLWCRFVVLFLLVSKAIAWLSKIESQSLRELKNRKRPTGDSLVKKRSRSLKGADTIAFHLPNSQFKAVFTMLVAFESGSQGELRLYSVLFITRKIFSLLLKNSLNNQVHLAIFYSGMD